MRSYPYLNEYINQIKNVYNIYIYILILKIRIIPPSYTILFLNRPTRLRYHHSTYTQHEFEGTYFSRVFSTSVSLIIWYLLNVPPRQHRFECSRLRTRAGWKKRVAPEKRKCVGGRERKREREREREREEGGKDGGEAGKGCVGADGVRDNTHGTDERVCLWRALFRIAGRFEKDKQLKKTKAQTAGARKWRKRNR